MKIARVRLKSASPLSQSKYHKTEMREKELAPDYEKRTWRERLHYDSNGEVFIPPMALRNCIYESARYLSLPIPGKARQTYTKHFESGILVSNPIPLGIQKDDVAHEWLFVPSDGKRGGGRRVEKCFPLIESWEGETDVYVFDDIITEGVFLQVLTGAGQFIGLGRFRPRNLGYYGRFSVENVEWQNGMK